MKDKYDTGTDDFLLKLDINTIETEWSAPTEFPDLTNCKTIAIDLETRDEGLGANKGPGWATNDGYVVGIAVAAGDFHGYFPIRHANGPNLDVQMTLAWLQDQMNTPNITKVCHNAPYDIGWLMAEGIKVQGPIIDTLIAAPLVDENRFSYRLDLLGKEYIGMRKDEKILRAAATEWGIDPKAEMWKLPARFVGGYGEQDAVMTLKLWDHLKGEIEKQELWSVFDLESRVLPAVIDMRATGVRVDLDQAERSRKILRDRKQELLAFVKDKTGVEVEVWAAESIKKVFEEQQIPYPRTEAGAPSFTKDFLKDHPNEVAQTINKIREADKADSTFIDSILKYEHKGRIHPEMHQLRGDDGGTVTGRMSSSHPNAQQLPARDPEIKKLIRGIFLPEEGEKWGSFDYSSQEPRMLTHFAAMMPDRMRSPTVDAFVEGYRSGDFDFHQMVADMTGLKRKEAKTCIAEGEPVLTHRGLVPIEKITLDDLVWDGLEWVQHEGVVFMGYKEVITYDGLTATPDHEVWVGRERTVPFGKAASRLERLVRTGVGERAVRIVDGCVPTDPASWKAYLRSSALRLWDRGLEGFRQLEAWAFNKLHLLSNQEAAQEGWEHAFELSGGDAACAARRVNFPTMQQPERQGLQQLRRSWDSMSLLQQKGALRLPLVTSQRGRVDGIRDRQDQQQRALRAGKPAPSNTGSKHAEQTSNAVGFLQGAGCGAGSPVAPDQNRLSALRVWSQQGSEAGGGGYETRRDSDLQTRRTSKVYDIKNAGPRHRFTVSGCLVHNCGLGITYGMGKAKLSNQLGVSAEEASRILETLDEKVPFIRQLSRAASQRAESQGQIRTIHGRLCRFDMWEPRSFGYNKPLKYEEAVKEYGTVGQGIRRAFTYKALNRLIQGSAADQTKLAFAQCYEAGHKPMLQVHDELCFSIATDGQANEIVEIMENGLELKVPSKVDVALEKDWGDVD